MRAAVRTAVALALAAGSLSSLAQLTRVRLPMLVANAELDPPDFVPDTINLIAGRKAAGMPFIQAPPR